MRVDIHSLSCATVFGGSGDHKQLILPHRYGEGPALQAATLKNVLYLPSILEIGQSICLTLDGVTPSRAILDQWTLDFVKGQISADQKAKYETEFEPDVSSLNVCILGNVFSRNFGHWTEEMLKVCILEHAKFDGKYVVSSLPRFSYEFLHLLDLKDSVVDVERPTIFKSAVFLTPVDHSNIDKYTHVLYMLRDLLFSKIQSTSCEFGEHIWLDRVSMVKNGGFLLNREEVFTLLDRYSFTAVDMGTLALADQLSIAKNMRIVCGVHGAQFVHVQFMPVASTVIECFSPLLVNQSVIGLCRALNHKYHQLVAINTPFFPYPHGRDLMIDCNHLELVLRNIFGGP